MASPWEKYQDIGSDSGKPWEKYGSSAEKPATPQPKKEEVKAPGFGIKDFAEGLVPSLIEGAKGGPVGMMVYPAKYTMDYGNKLLGHIGDIGASSAQKYATSIGAPPEIAGGLAAGVKTGAEAVPFLVGGGIGTKGVPLVEKGAERLMQSALKPTKEELLSGDAQKAIRTMLDEGISVSEGGLNKLKDKIYGLNDQISAAIQNSPATVNKDKVLETLKGLTERTLQQVNPQAGLAAIEKAARGFIEHPLLKQISEIPVQTAQKLKQGTYRALGDSAYGEISTADKEAQKAIARGLKEGISGGIPGIQSLNSAESKLLNALNVSEKRILMSANKNPLGLAPLAASPEKMAAFLLDKSDHFKSLLARILDKEARSISGGVGAIAVPGAIEMKRQSENRPPQ